MVKALGCIPEFHDGDIYYFLFFFKPTTGSAQTQEIDNWGFTRTKNQPGQVLSSLHHNTVTCTCEDINTSYRYYMPMLWNIFLQNPLSNVGRVFRENGYEE